MDLGIILAVVTAVAFFAMIFFVRRPNDDQDSSGAHTSQTTKHTKSEGAVPRWIDESKDRGQKVNPSDQWSQGRRVPEQIPTNANTPIAESESVWGYIHEYVAASTIKEEKGMMGMGLAQEIATSYPQGEIETHLNKRGSEGWKLITMEPH